MEGKESRGQVIGKSIRAKRDEKGWSQVQLANLCDTTETTVGRWEKGKHVPRGANRVALCRVLGVTWDELEFGLTASEYQDLRLLINTLIRIQDYKRQSGLMYLGGIIAVVFALLFTVAAVVADMQGDAAHWAEFLLYMLCLFAIAIALFIAAEVLWYRARKTIKENKGLLQKS